MAQNWSNASLRRLAVGFLLCSCLIGNTLSAESHSREWTSIDGRKLTASVLLIDSAAETIKLKRNDGVIFTLEWRRLSPPDIEWIQDYHEEIQSLTDTTTSEPNDPTEAVDLPELFKLKGVPMVTQKGNYCVPASATMISEFHGLKTNQDEVAQLSSESSASNLGTYAIDMLLAMEKLGFEGHELYWREDEFLDKALPAIRHSLYTTGPIYISFKPGVFGTMGHGCIIIGYNDRREQLTFHNPWGNVFIKSYDDVAIEGNGVVFLNPPKSAPTASEDFIQSIEKQIPKFDGNFLRLAGLLMHQKVPHELAWCSRRDSRHDKHFAKDTAREDGRRILELAFERNPAVIIPSSPKGKTEAYYLVTRPPNGGANFMVHTITESGWSEPKLQTLGSLTREWATEFVVPELADPVWELPMIELQTND